MSHHVKRAGHIRAKIFYMSPNEKITLFNQSQYKITAIKYYICPLTTASDVANIAGAYN